MTNLDVHNNIKWSGFFLNEEAAQKALEAMCKQESKKGCRIISAKKILQLKKKDAYFLYSFNIIKASQDA